MPAPTTSGCSRRTAFTGHYTGQLGAAQPEARLRYDVAAAAIELTVTNPGNADLAVQVTANAYFDTGPWQATIAPGQRWMQSFPLAASGRWYDFTLSAPALPAYTRRFAGRLETGRNSVSDPAMGGTARGQQAVIA
jgi:phospholipase C